jgi:hypothetical protein
MNQLLAVVTLSIGYLTFHWILSTFVLKRPATAFEIRKYFIYLCLVAAAIYATFDLLLQNGK